jgi:hypothetical protein
MAKLLRAAALSLLSLLVLPIAATAQQPAILHVNGADPTCGGLDNVKFRKLLVKQDLGMDR